MDEEHKNRTILVIIGIIIIILLFFGAYSIFGKNSNDNPLNGENGLNEELNDVIDEKDDEVNKKGNILEEYLKCTKVEKRDNIVFSEEECIIKITEDKNYRMRLPQINLNNSNIINLNKVIKVKYEEDKKRFTFNNKGELLSFGYLDYIFHSNNGIISLIIKREAITLNAHAWSPAYEIYNIDISTGDNLTSEELLTKLNLKDTSLAGNIQGAVKRIYLNDLEYNVDDNKDSIIENYFNSLYRVMFDNIYINDKGILVILLELPIPDFGDNVTYLIEIDKNTATYKSKMPF